jgi:hypothetical protein
VDVACTGAAALNCSPLWTWDGLPGESSCDGSPGFLPGCCVVMAAGTSPSEVVLADGGTAVAFHASNGDP